MVMQALILPLRSLVDPVGVVPLLIEQRRWFISLLAAALFTAAGSAAVATRLDTARQVIPQMQMSGALMKSSEREVNEAIEQAQRVALVGGVARGLLAVPLMVLLLAVALKVASWLIGRKAQFYGLFVAASLAFLPTAIFHGIELFAALRLDLITPAMASALVPSSLLALTGAHSPGLDRVYGAIDFFNLWGALLMGLGFATAAKWSLSKGALFGLFLYALFASAVLVGLPGLLAGLGAGGMS